MKKKSDPPVQLDIEFYRAYYADLSEFNDEELRIHWASFGKNEGRLSNPEQALTELIRHPKLPAGFDIRAYLTLNPDVAAAIRWRYQGILHYLNHGEGENRAYSYNSSGALTKQTVSKHSKPVDPGCADAAKGSAAQLANGKFEEDVGGVSARSNGALLTVPSSAPEIIQHPMVENSRFRLIMKLASRVDRFLSTASSEKASKEHLLIRNVANAVRANGNGSATNGRAAWRKYVKTHGRNAATVAFSKQHAAVLGGGFNLATYLARYADVATSIEDPIFGVFHYLEFGIDERRSGAPEQCDANFVQELYDFKPRASTPIDMLQEIREAHQLTLFDLVYLTESELASSHSVRTSQFLEIFDHEYYRAVALGADAASHNRAKCLVHFFQKGQYKPFDVNCEWAFDAEFYCREYGRSVETSVRSVQAYADQIAHERTEGNTKKSSEELFDLNGEQKSKVFLYRDWLINGFAKGRVPNLDIWTLREYGIKIPSSIKTQLEKYSAIEGGLSSASAPSEVCRHLIEVPGEGVNTLLLSDSPGANFITKIGDRFSISGDVGNADRMYSKVLKSFPYHPQARRHQVDLLQRLNLTGLAIGLRSKIIDEGLHDIWSYISIAECYSKLGDDLTAAEWLKRGVDAYPADVGIRLRARNQALKAFDLLWNSSVTLALAEGIERTQGYLRRALEIYTPHVEHVEVEREIRTIAIVGHEDLAQCKFYRLDQKAEHLTAAGYDVEFFNYTDNLPEYMRRMAQFDATIFYRVPAFPNVIDAITKTNEFGIPTFYEIDDLIFDADHYPPTFESYENQISREQYVALACGVPLFEHAMSLCEYGIASTRTLQRLMAERVRSGRVFLHRNAFGRMHEAMLNSVIRRNDPSVCNIFYGSGTKAHKQDFQNLLVPALIEVVRKHGEKVRVIIVGDIHLSEPLRQIERNLVMLQPIWDTEDYYVNLLSRADINLSVLEPSLMADCKSEIKWLEAAMFGIPSVVSDTATHREVIEHGRTGYLCRSAAEFAEMIDMLVREPALRNKVGTAAKSEAVEKYGIESQASNIRQIFNSISTFKPRKRRILIVNVFYPPQAIGGATRVVYDNVTDLKAQFGDQFEINVLCTLEGGKTPYELNHYSYEGVRVFSITSPSEPDIDKKTADHKMAKVFSSCLDAIKPELIHFHCIQRLTASIVEVARHRNVPYLITAHDGWWVSPYQFLVSDHDEIETYDFRTSDLLASQPSERISTRADALRKPLMGAAKILTVSKEFEEVYRSTGLDNVTTVENGVSRLLNCVRTVSPDGRVRIAHIGGASRHKGYHLVRNAIHANSFENLRLLVIDHALPKGVVHHEIWGTTPVMIMAKVDQAKIQELYAQIDVLLAPSIWPESFGLVTREALAAGCWVVASDRGAIGACIEEGVNGYRVDVSSHLGLANALDRLDKSSAQFTKPPQNTAPLRTATEQAKELAAWYSKILEMNETDKVSASCHGVCG